MKVLAAFVVIVVSLAGFMYAGSAVVHHFQQAVAVHQRVVAQA